MSAPNRSAGRFELRRRMLLGLWVILGVAIVVRATQLQLVQSADWRERAAGQQQMSSEVDAPRGTIYDRDGVALAISLERYRIEIDADQLEDRALVRDRLREALGVTESAAANYTDPGRDWVVVPGRYDPAVRSLLDDLKHVHLFRELRRSYPHQGLAAGVLGRVVDGRGGQGGIEQSFDDLLSGVPGRSVVARDNHGNQIPGQTHEVTPPRAGSDVYLTIDMDLQEIAHQALLEAIEANEARGGDLVATDPGTGEILAMVSIEGGRSNGNGVIGSPYEPGSTLKPFTVAALLQSGKARLTDRIDIGNGSWRINSRTLNDTHVDSSNISLADALRESSNVGIAKAALALTPREQYEMLRDFGFGVPTGIPLPGESKGLLRPPSGWTGPSPQSLAIGYELNATPLQMAMAYGALANGGQLMEARLVRSTRTPDHAVTERGPTVLRRVLEGGITGQIGQVLVDVVEEGTGTRAQLETFRVAGKTGTSRAYGDNGYEPGHYYGSFAGYFPADAPQLVIFVKLDDPKAGSYYGGATAAPVTRAIMEAALAARQSPLDRQALLSSVRGPEAEARALPPVRFAAVEPVPVPLPDARDPTPSLDYVAPSEVTIPDLSGVSVRSAVRRLHALGFRVSLEAGTSTRSVTIPKPGTRWAVGDTVRVLTGRPFR